MPSWMTTPWAGFNAGAVLGLFDALLVMMFGLARFDQTGPIVGIIFIDALGMGVIGLGVLTLGYYGFVRIFHVRARLALVVSGMLLLGIAAGITGRNLAWVMTYRTDAPCTAKKNLLIITIDTFRGDSAGFSGNHIVMTPMLDKLAHRGWQFCNAVCPVPMTTPSHASIFTSTIPAVHGAKENRYRLNDDNETLAEILRGKGFQTAAFVSCFPLDRRFKLDQGFMLYQDDFSAPGDLRQASWLKVFLRLKHRSRRERPAQHTNSLVIPWLRKYGKAHPFFLWVHYFDPHAPYVPEDVDWKPYQNAGVTALPFRDAAAVKKAEAAAGFRRNLLRQGLPEELYLGEITHTDRALEHLFLELERLNLRENTDVVVVADHGESMGEHGLFYTHGEDIFEPALHIPMIFFGKDFPGAVLSDALASNLDIAPTALHALSIPRGEKMEGYDLFASTRRPFALVENFGIIMAAGAEKQRGLRTDHYKYIYNYSSRRSGLYNLENDPGERRDIAGENGALVENFSGIVERGFDKAAHRAHDSRMDVSKETLEKLKALGYSF